MGALGLMSRNATTISSWWTMSAGISPSAMPQNRQSDGHAPPNARSAAAGRGGSAASGDPGPRASHRAVRDLTIDVLDLTRPIAFSRSSRRRRTATSTWSSRGRPSAHRRGRCSMSTSRSSRGALARTPRGPRPRARGAPPRGASSSAPRPGRPCASPASRAAPSSGRRAARRPDALMNATVRSNAASSSVGKPAITSRVDRDPGDGGAGALDDRAYSPDAYRRPIRRRTPSSPDCRGRWRCGSVRGAPRTQAPSSSSSTCCGSIDERRSRSTSVSARIRRTSPASVSAERVCAPRGPRSDQPPSYVPTLIPVSTTSRCPARPPAGHPRARVPARGSVPGRAPAG